MLNAYLQVRGQNMRNLSYTLVFAALLLASCNHSSVVGTLYTTDGDIEDVAEETAEYDGDTHIDDDSGVDGDAADSAESERDRPESELESDELACAEYAKRCTNGWVELCRSGSWTAYQDCTYAPGGTCDGGFCLNADGDAAEAEPERPEDTATWPVWEDAVTGLKWEKKTEASLVALTYAEATAYCEAAGWRVPTLAELRSIVRGCKNIEPDGACMPDNSGAAVWAERAVCMGCGESHTATPGSCLLAFSEDAPTCIHGIMFSRTSVNDLASSYWCLTSGSLEVCLKSDSYNIRCVRER